MQYIFHADASRSEKPKPDTIYRYIKHVALFLNPSTSHSLQTEAQRRKMCKLNFEEKKAMNVPKRHSINMTTTAQNYFLTAPHTNDSTAESFLIFQTKSRQRNQTLSTFVD